MHPPYANRGVLTLHRDNLNDIFIARGVGCGCLRLPDSLRFAAFVVAALSGFFLLAMTLPLTGRVHDLPVVFAAVYFAAKLLLYAAIATLASPVKQLLHSCRPVRFCAIAFAVLGTAGVWLTFFAVSASVVLLLISLLLQMASFAFYILSYLSFTHNILFECIKRPAFGRTVRQRVACLRHRPADAEIELQPEAH